MRIIVMVSYIGLSYDDVLSQLRLLDKYWVKMADMQNSKTSRNVTKMHL